MDRRTWLGSLAAVLTLFAVGTWFGLTTVNAENLVPTDSPSIRLSVCCPPECCPPECCPGCCETGQVAKKKPAVEKTDLTKAESFTCPLTGEPLPCPKCCPLNQEAAQASAKNNCCPPCPFCP